MTFKLVKNKNLIEKELNMKKINVPYNWHIKKVEQISKIVGGGTPPTNINSYWGGEICWVGPKEMSKVNEPYISMGERFITEEGAKKLKGKKILKDSIILSTRAPVGYVKIAKNDLYTNQGCHSMILNKSVSSFYIYYLFIKNKILFNEFSTGSTFKELSSKNLKNLQFAIPSFEEQVRIANVLLKQESIILNIEKLISKTEKIFEYFCDNLISGKMILENNKLINNINKNNIKKYKLENFLKMYPNTKKYQIKSKDILESGTIPVISQEKEKISGYSNKKDYIMADKNNPIIVFGDHSCTLKLIDFNFILGGDGTKVFTSNNNETLFLYYLIKNLGLKTEGYKRHFSILKEKLVVDIPNKLDVCKILLNIEQLIENQKKLLEKEKQKFEWLSEKLLSGEYLVVEEQE